MKNSNSGRKKGSGNKFSKTTSTHYKEWIIEKADVSFKYFPVLSNEKKVSETRKYIELLLSNCSKEEKEEISNLIYLKLKKDIEKIDTYISYLDPDEKAKECRMFLTLLKPEHIKEVGEYLSKKARDGRSRQG